MLLLASLAAHAVWAFFMTKCIAIVGKNTAQKIQAYLMMVNAFDELTSCMAWGHTYHGVLSCQPFAGKQLPLKLCTSAAF